jgi:hypothetical protein
METIKRKTVGIILEDLFKWGNSAKEITERLYRQLKKHGYSKKMCKEAVNMAGRGVPRDDVLEYLERARDLKKKAEKKWKGETYFHEH